MSLGELIDAYSQHLSEGSPHSLLAFKPVARALEGWRNKAVGSITPAQWRRWLSEQTQERAPSTRNLWYRQLRALYNFPSRWLGVVGGPPNPLAGAAWRRIAPTPGRPYRARLTDEQVETLCRLPKMRSGRLLVRLLAERGRRLGEVLRLTPGDRRDLVAGSGDRRVLVFGKTKAGIEQYTVLPPALALEVSAYVAENAVGEQDRLFPFTQQNARSILDHASAKLGIHVSPHDLRRAFSTRLERQGVPLGTIQALLGHSNGQSVVERHYIAERQPEELATV
jgi:integrase